MSRRPAMERVMSDPTKTPIKYIGHDELYIDRIYGTGLEFAPGQTRDVDFEPARRMLQHTDLFELSTSTELSAREALAVRSAMEAADGLAGYKFNSLTGNIRKPGALTAGAEAVFYMDHILPVAYGAKHDGQIVYDAVVSGSSAAAMTIVSSTAIFTQDDVGKPCAHKPKTANGNYTRYGTITAVVDANTVTVSLNGVTAGSGHLFVWGSDDTAAMNAALTAAKTKKAPVYLPSGITTCTGRVVVPTGVTLRGSGNANGVGYARDFEHYNSSLILLGYLNNSVAGGFVRVGDNGYGNNVTNSGTRGSVLRDLNIDALDLADGGGCRNGRWGGCFSRLSLLCSNCSKGRACRTGFGGCGSLLTNSASGRWAVPNSRRRLSCNKLLDVRREAGASYLQDRRERHQSERLSRLEGCRFSDRNRADIPC